MFIGDGGGLLAEAMSISMSQLGGGSKTSCTGSAGNGGLLSNLMGGSLGDLFGGGADGDGFSFEGGGELSLADGSSLSFDFSFNTNPSDGESQTTTESSDGESGNSISDILDDWAEDTLNKSVEDMLSELGEGKWQELLAKSLEQLLGDLGDESGNSEQSGEDAGIGLNIADLLSGDGSVTIEVSGDDNTIEVDMA